MLIEYGVWVSRLVVGVVFGLAAWGKAADRVGTRTAVTDFGVPIRWTPAVAVGLPVAETAVAVGMLIPVAAVAASVLALVLLIVFSAAVLRLLARGKRPACSCFGASSAAPIGPETVVRNAVIAVPVVLAGVGSLLRPEVPAGLPGRDALGLTVLAVLVAALFRLSGTVSGLRRRLDEQALSTLGAEGLPVGSVAPEFDLVDRDGARTNLEGQRPVGWWTSDRREPRV